MSSSSSSDDEYGPALPPGVGASSSKRVLGPALPTHIPEQADESEEESGVVGPMPSLHGGTLDDSVSAEFERRANKMKAKLTSNEDDESNVTHREEWMTELPPELSKNFGLENRQFSRGSGKPKIDGDRSVWTDTPQSKKEKESKGSSSKQKKRKVEGFSARDEMLQQQVDSYNEAKRAKTLLEMHEKKMKKKKKKEKKEKKKKKERGEKEEKPVRKPFDRDTDLKANQFDEAQRKKLIQKSAVLNTRFTKGATTAHFL